MLENIVHGGISNEDASRISRMRLLCYFRHRWLDFRHSEILSVASNGSDLNWDVPFGGNALSPFWYLDVPDLETAEAIAQRALLLKAFLQVWGEGVDFKELRQSIENCPEDIKTPFYSKDISFKVMVDGWGFKLSQKEKVEAIEKLNFLPLEGPVDLKEAQQIYWLIIVNPSRLTGFDGAPNRVYFGRQISIPDLSVIQKYALPQRPFLGPTSMDAEMAMIMCNHGRVRRGSIVVDPFVGTGSILVSAAHYGAITIGCDIDPRILKQSKENKRGEMCDIWSNFSAYGLQPPVGLVLCDMHHPPFRATSPEIFDAVICDPPYGVRARSKKKSAGEDGSLDSGLSHYTVSEMVRDLFEFSATNLKIGGRLVFFCPGTPGTLSWTCLPKHPTLHPLFCCEQHLTTKYSRYLITMEKTKHYDMTEVAFSDQGKWKMPEDNFHDIVFEKRTSAPGKQSLIPKFRCKQL